MDEFRFDAMLRETVVTTKDGRMAYRIVTADEMKDWNLTPSEVKNFIPAYGNVREIEIYAIICEMPESDPAAYEGSLRSKTVKINDIAERFRGGGHPNACGVRGLSGSEVKDLLNALHARITE